MIGVSRFLNLGNGSTWPGHIAFKFFPQILTYMSLQIKNGAILVAGTNGKTTTAKMIRTILESGSTKYASRVVHNDSGANLLNGIVSSLICAADWKGNISAQWGIFEVDEATLPLALKEFTPKFVVLLNLFRDQLDRYGELDLIAQKWQKALLDLPETSQIILNTDDPQIAFLGRELRAKVAYFGLEDPKIALKEKQHAMDTTYCPKCGAKLEFSRIYFSHLGKWRCPKCKIHRPEPNLDSWDYPLHGTYNRYNTLAAVLTCEMSGLNKAQIQKSLVGFKPAFGRQEEFEVDGKKIKMILAKNPTGFNESIRTLGGNEKKKTVLLILNDRIPDGRDVSWIWDIDTEELLKQVDGIIISGERAYDMALRIKYSGSSEFQIEEDLKKAISLGVEQTPKTEILYILPTYSAMLEVRKIIAGRRIL